MQYHLSMKVCTRCSVEKPDEEFPWRKKDFKRASACKECQRKLGREHYKNNKNKYSESAQRNRPNYVLRNKEYVIEYLKSNPCVDCGEIDIMVLEFDHREPLLKRGSRISNFYGSSLETLKKEIAKCDVVCANCHARRTAKHFGSFRLDYI